MAPSSSSDRPHERADEKRPLPLRLLSLASSSPPLLSSLSPPAAPPAASIGPLLPRSGSRFPGAAGASGLHSLQGNR
jgi:hypothetical protein